MGASVIAIFRSLWLPPCLQLFPPLPSNISIDRGSTFITSILISDFMNRWFGFPDRNDRNIGLLLMLTFFRSDQWGCCADAELFIVFFWSGLRSKSQPMPSDSCLSTVTIRLGAVTKGQGNYQSSDLWLFFHKPITFSFFFFLDILSFELSIDWFIHSFSIWKTPSKEQNDVILVITETKNPNDCSISKIQKS